jgi:DNA replication protein DnaC
MTTCNVDLDTLLARLSLAWTRKNHRALVERAETEQWAYHDFLATIAAEEVAHRRQSRLRRRTVAAHFPFLKTIDEFDFSLQSTLRLSLLGSYLGPELVGEGRNLVLFGKPGRGKTHLAIAIAYRAIQNGYDSLFTTAAALIDDLSQAFRQNAFRSALATYIDPHVLIIDEVGYLSYGPDAANVLFHVVNERHLKKRPMIFTTNKPLAAWGSVLHDADLAEAIIDRILERGRFLALDGPSSRTRHLKPQELSAATEDPTPPEPARISGKTPAEFPEPTLGLGGRREWLGRKHETGADACEAGAAWAPCSRRTSEIAMKAASASQV